MAVLLAGAAALMNAGFAAGSGEACSGASRCGDGFVVASRDDRHQDRAVRANRRYATLRQGALLGKFWRARIYARSGTQPCYELATQTSGVTIIGGECGRPRRGFIPVLTGQTGNGKTIGNVMVLITPITVHRVDLSLGGRPDKTVWPKRISKVKAHRAGLDADFRYKVFAGGGRWCLRHHADYDRRGEVFYRSLRYPPCRDQRSG
jgi:hypothetical protein